MPNILNRRIVLINTGSNVANYITVNGVTYQLLYGLDRLPLQGLDGQYLYGV